jgi:riboflavin biosynthesis pyrimidine reductase
VLSRKKETTHVLHAIAAMVHVEQSMIMFSNVQSVTDKNSHLYAILRGVSVVATLVVGSDGSTSKESRSAGVSSPEDRKAFLQRRREVDVIIVGGNTARHEPYNRTPVPLVVISRSLVNPVQGNHLALFWNCSPVSAIEKARTLFGEKILIEGGVSMINELIAHSLIDQLELSVTPATGGQDRIDIQQLLSHFSTVEKREESGTVFYSARN